MYNGDINIKLTEEVKQNILLRMTNFINSLKEDDKIFMDGQQSLDLIENTGKIKFYISAEKVIDNDIQTETL